MGNLLKIKCVGSSVNGQILASTSVPFTLKTLQVPNLELTENSVGRVAKGVFYIER
jgi:hypothetical protein